MCVSAAPARFSATILYGAAVDHPQHGLVHVLGYQNTAQNLAEGPNAMLLHLRARELAPAHFLDTSGCRGILRTMVEAVETPTLSADAAQPDGIWHSARVFEHDIYTVILAADARHIPAVLHRVEPRKRIAANPDLFAFYAEWFPDHPIALCCFDNRDAAVAAPLLVWYRPLDPGTVAMPAIDCHTGAAPDLDAPVLVDHWVLTSAPGMGAAVDYGSVPDAVRPFLPDRVLGTAVRRTAPNGDFVIRPGEARLDGITVHRRTPGPAPRELPIGQAGWPEAAHALLAAALALARTAHAGQRDKSGQPYMEHVEGVMARLPDPLERTVAALHDTVEDTELTLEDLRSRGFPDTVVEAVDALTRRPHEPYREFIRRAGTHPVARAVKIADLLDNSDEQRLARLDPRDAGRLRRRYRDALASLGVAS